MLTTVASLLDAFSRCPDARHNCVHLADLAEAAGLGRADATGLDWALYLRQLRDARRQGLLVLKLAEGGRRFSPRDRAAMVIEDGRAYLFCGLRK